MTPLIQKIVRAAERRRLRFCPELTRLKVTGQIVVGMISECEVYQIDDADMDTTNARQAHPAYFATGVGLTLPAQRCWLEYKCYTSEGRDTGLRSAFLAETLPSGGIRVFSAGEDPDDGACVFVHCFDLPSHMVASSAVLEGQRFVLRTNLADQRLETVANFFMELVEFLNLPSGLSLEHVQPHAGTGRRMRAMCGARTKVRPHRRVTFDLSQMAFQ